MTQEPSRWWSLGPTSQKAALVLVCCIFGLVGRVVYGAYGDSLRQRRDGIQSQMSRVKTQKAEASSEAERLRGELGASQARLAAAVQEHDKAQADIHEAEEGIQEAAEARDRALAEIRDSQETLDTRLVAIYKAGTTSYADVILGAGDFTEMTTRAYLCRKIVDHDIELLNTIEERKKAAEREQQRLEMEEARLEKAEARLLAARKRRAQETETHEQLLAAQNAVVSEWEAKEAQLDAESRQIEAQLAALARGTSGGAQPAQPWTGAWSRPCPGRIGPGGRYGMRRHPILGYTRMHHGVDIGAGYGTAVTAAGSGIVHETTRSSRGYGNKVIINHGNGRTTLYAHLSSISVSRGQAVQTGQKIGEVGSTGLSTGPHLHFEVRINGKSTNPVL